MNQENLPAWYLSTQGPQLSMTLKSLLALLLPTLNVLFPQVTIFNEQADALIDALLIVLFGVGMLVGHIRAKRALQREVASLKSQVGATQHKCSPCVCPSSR